jgi:hypothetical protein
MTPYLLVFAAFLATYFVLETTAGHRAPSSAERWVLVVPLAVFAVLYAGRIGTDVESYGGLFDIAEDFPVEPGFSLLMIGAKTLGLDYVGFTKVLAVAQMLLLASVVMRLRDPLFFLLFYLGSFFLNFQFNAIRNSFALLIVAALYVRLPRPGLLTLVSSSVIHYSSLLTLALQRMSLSRRQGLAITLAGVAAGIVALIWLKPDLLGSTVADLFVYKGYLELEYEAKPVYPALLLKLLVLWLMYRNGANRFYTAAYAILVVLIHAVSPILSRLSDLVLFLAVLDFCARYRLQRLRLAAIAFTCVLVASSVMIPWSDCRTGGNDNWCLSGANAR